MIRHEFRGLRSSLVTTSLTAIPASIRGSVIHFTIQKEGYIPSFPTVKVKLSGEGLVAIVYAINVLGECGIGGTLHGMSTRLRAAAVLPDGHLP